MSPIGRDISSALAGLGRTQKWLADQLSIDASQVSRWVTAKQEPSLENARTIDGLLGTDITSLRAAGRSDTQRYGVYLAAPLTSVGSAEFAPHREAIDRLARVIESIAGSVYWAGTGQTESERTADDLRTEQNLAAMQVSSCVAMIQLVPTVRPSSALVELGMALGLGRQTTIFTTDQAHLPSMLGGFSAVAERVAPLPRVRIYVVEDVQDAVDLIEQHGNDFFP